MKSQAIAVTPPARQFDRRHRRAGGDVEDRLARAGTERLAQWPRRQDASRPPERTVLVTS